MTHPLDLLNQVAKLAYETAPCSCNQTSKADSCQPYHAAWPYLRLAKVVSGAQADEIFFQESFDNFANLSNRSSILIAGAADHAILDQVFKTCQKNSVQPNITIIDHCETPLKINNWYANQIGARINTIHLNLFELNEVNKFDLIVAHSIFSFIPQEMHLQLIRKWSSLLNSNGLVVMSQAFRPGYLGPSLRRFNGAEIDIFVNRFLTNIKANAEQCSLSETALEDLARCFAEYKTAYTVTDDEMLKNFFEASEFYLENFYAINRQKHFINSASPDSSDSIHSLRIVARRI